MRPSALLAAVGSLLLAAIIVASLGLNAGNPTVTVAPTPQVDVKDMPQPSKTGPHPKLVADELIYDFGIAPHGTKGTHDFVVKNTGEAPLQIKIGQKSCQCTLAKESNDSIPPGGEAKVTLSWEIKAHVVRFEHFAKLHTNDPTQQEIQFKIRGVVGQSVGTHPPGAWSIGDINAGSTRSVKGYLLSHFNEKLELQLVDPSPEFKVEVVPVSDAEKSGVVATVFGEMQQELNKSGVTNEQLQGWLKSVYAVTVSTDGSGKAGAFSESLLFKTNDTEKPEVTVTVTGSRPAPFEFLAPIGIRLFPKDLTISTGDYPVAEGTKGSCLIYARGADAGIQIEQPVCDPDWVKATITPGMAPKQFKLSIVIPPNSPSATRTISDPVLINMKTTHPAMPELQMKLLLAPQS